MPFENLTYRKECLSIHSSIFQMIVLILMDLKILDFHFDDNIHLSLTLKKKFLPCDCNSQAKDIS